MNTDIPNSLYTDNDVCLAYSKLRSLTQEEFFASDIGYKEAKLHQTQVIEQERGLSPEKRERRGDLALAEGLVDVFCHVAEWIGLRVVDSLNELFIEKEKLDIYFWLMNIISYRSCHSAKLGAKVVNEELFFTGDKLRLKSIVEIQNSDQVSIVIQNMILLCDTAERAIGRYTARTECIKWLARFTPLGRKKPYNVKLKFSIREKTFI